jgi:uncharacterized SAM-binding protein YcdF (DUF218 family)
VSARRALDVVCGAIGAASVTAGLVLMFTPVADAINRQFALRPRIEPADAIVVLGASGVRADGSLGNDSLRRTMIGIDLYRRGLAPLIVLSGGTNERGQVEADVRSRLVVASGVPERAIATETAARTTREEAANIAATLAPKGVRTILLVVDLPGTRRASALFERRGLRVFPAPTEDPDGETLAPEHRLQLARHLAVELTAWSYYRLAGHL